MDFRSPMLAKDYDPAKLTFPKLASPKVDGWRSVIYGSKNATAGVTTRSGKPVRNRFVQSLFTKVGLEGLDGEMTVGHWHDQGTFNRTDAGMKKFEGEPDTRFWVFDHYKMEGHRYNDRLSAAAKQVAEFNEWFASDTNMRTTSEEGLWVPRVAILPHKMIYNLEQLDECEGEWLEMGFEGLMLNDPDGFYKYGRSTVNEGLLLKVKRYVHDEARIVGFEEQMINTNEAFKDELGRTKRASNKENLVPSGKLGSYICKNDEKWPGQTFNVSCGSMTHHEKGLRWLEREKDLNEIIRFKHLPHGALVKPRHGIFDGFRAEEDATALA